MSTRRVVPGIIVAMPATGSARVGVVLMIAIAIVLRAILVVVVVTVSVAGVLVPLIVCSSA